MNRILDDVEASIVVLTQDIIRELQLQQNGILIQFIDWDANMDNPELPDHDLVGPGFLAVSEDTAGIISASFALAVSTYDDRNLFRLKSYISYIFERLRPTKTMILYDSLGAVEKGFMVFQDGTHTPPMVKTATRPWRYVQVSALLDPEATAH